MNRIYRINDWPLAIKLLVVMILITLIPLAVVGFLNVRNTQQSLQEAITRAFERETQDVSALVAGFLAEETLVLQPLTVDADILNALEERNTGYQGSEDDILTELLELDEVWINGDDTEPLIVNTLSTDPAVNPVSNILGGYEQLFEDHVEIFITDAYGGTLGSTNRLSDYYQADEDWWQAAFNNGQGAIFISDPEFDESANVTAILIAFPVFDQTSDEIIGVVRSTVVIDAIFNELNEIVIGETGRVMLLNKQGDIIADPNATGVAQLPAETRLAILRSDGAGIHEDEDDELTVFGHAKLAFLQAEKEEEEVTTRREALLEQTLEELGWVVVIREKASEAFLPVTNATILAVLTSIAAIILAAAVAFGLAQLLTRQVGRITELFSAIGIGDFEARVEVTSGDELGQMATSLNAMLDNTLVLIQTQEERDALQASIRKLLEEVSVVAEGDLTIEAEVTADATGAIADSFNFMIEQLRTIISQVQDATLQVSSSANEIQATAEHLSQGSETQANQIINTSAAIDEMTVSIQQVSENAVMSATVAEQALTNARQGTQAVQNTIEGMDRIRNQVQETAKRIKRLGESSQEIGEIVQLISDIADRTSILALNASIQAAMAGEAGRGFAVVAEEVERLAERATDATSQISNLVKTIQSETNETVAAMEESTQEVVKGSEVANQAGKALAEIESVSGRLAELIQSISLASKQQARGSEAVAQSMGDIANVTQQTAAGTKEAAVSINNLAVLADTLRGSVSTFKLPNGANGHG